MKNIEKFLFVYSLLITTVVLFAAILFAPKPSNFMIILFLVPVVYYFWLKMVADDINKKSNKAFGKRMLTIIAVIFITSAILSSFGIYLYSKRVTKEVVSDKAAQQVLSDNILDSKDEPQKQELPKDIGEELAAIKEELIKLRAEQRGITNILGISTSPTELQEIMSDLENVDGVDVLTEDKASLGSISVRDNYTRIDAHTEAAASSRIVGSINKGKVYSYSDRNGNWYLVKTDQGTSGWVFASFVEEVIP